jgi:hypothetical protein
LTSYTSYTGPDQLHIGDGKGLDILYIGFGYLKTPSDTLILSNVLHVPSIAKPLLSISQLTTDNNVYVQFYNNLCFNGSEGVGSRFHVMRIRTHFGRYRWRRVPFSCFTLPDSFGVVLRASGLVFMFYSPGLIFDGTESIGSHFHV